MSVSNPAWLPRGRKYEGEWKDATKELPEDSIPVIVLTDEYIVSMGYILDGDWQLVQIPWGNHNEEDGVIFWTDYPPTPAEEPPG